MTCCGCMKDVHANSIDDLVQCQFSKEVRVRDRVDFYKCSCPYSEKDLMLLSVSFDFILTLL